MRLFQALYQISTSAVRVDDDINEWFSTLTGVRHASSHCHSFSSLLNNIATAFHHFAGISHQFGNPWPEYWHQRVGYDHQQPPVCWQYRPVGWLCWRPLNTRYKHPHCKQEVWFDNQKGENRGLNDYQMKQAYVRLHWWEKSETSRDLHLSRYHRKINLHCDIKKWLAKLWEKCRNCLQFGSQKISQQKPKWNCIGCWFYLSVHLNPGHSRSEMNIDSWFLVFEMSCLRRILDVSRLESYGARYHDPVMSHNLLPRLGTNPKIVNFMAPTPNRSDYILPGPDRTETFLSPIRNYTVSDYNKPMNTTWNEAITSYNMLISILYSLY